MSEQKGTSISPFRPIRPIPQTTTMFDRSQFYGLPETGPNRFVKSNRFLDAIATMDPIDARLITAYHRHQHDHGPVDHTAAILGPDLFQQLDRHILDLGLAYRVNPPIFAQRFPTLTTPKGQLSFAMLYSNIAIFVDYKTKGRFELLDPSHPDTPEGQGMLEIIRLAKQPLRTHSTPAGVA